MIFTHYQLGLHDIGQTDYLRLELPNRRLPHWVVSHVRYGEVKVDAPEGKAVAPFGSVMVHPPHLPFTERSSGPGTHQWVQLEAKLGSGLELLSGSTLPRVVALLDPEAYSATFGRLQEVWLEPPSILRDLRAAAHLLELLAQVHAAGTLSVHGGSHARFARVVAYMRQNLHAPLSRAELAERANLHPTHFDRAFKGVYGLSPLQLLRELRLEQVKRALEGSDWSLERIAEECGLRDAAYLSRVFRAHHGETPGTYRKRYKSAKERYF